MSKADVYSIKGVKSGSISLPKEFSAKENWPLLAQAIRVYNARLHIGHAKVKTRAEVNRTKKKVYRQKGTGGARHGARSAPIYVGGGVAHGPKMVKRELSLSKKIAKQALNVALSLKAKENEIVVVGGLGSVIKTREVAVLVNSITKAQEAINRRFTIALSEGNLKIGRNLKNLEDVKFLPYKNLNAYQVFFGGTLVLDKEIFEAKSVNPKTKVSINKEGSKK